MLIKSKLRLCKARWPELLGSSLPLNAICSQCEKCQHTRTEIIHHMAARKIHLMSFFSLHNQCLTCPKVIVLKIVSLSRHSIDFGSILITTISHKYFYFFLKILATFSNISVGLTVLYQASILNFRWPFVQPSSLKLHHKDSLGVFLLESNCPE